jgi:mono/diheme cytochrome c family protein/plastocyanin
MTITDAGEVSRTRTAEYAARVAVGVTLGLPLILVLAWWLGRLDGAQPVRARVAEDGGWSPDALTARVGEPLRMRLASEDVVHGFAIGHSRHPVIELQPGQPVEVSMTFEQPGRFVFYCTRWCGPNHWRMRGTIEVSGDGPAVAEPPIPAYVELGIDLDTPHPAAVVPGRRPSADRGAALGVEIPSRYRSREATLGLSPAELWQGLRDEPATRDLADAQVWDLTAWAMRSTISDESMAEGQQLFSENCAACHGRDGAGEAAAQRDTAHAAADGEMHAVEPVDFTDAGSMLGASPALLQGKILRGGMGSGMPYWGPIFTDDQLWALASYLWTFQFEGWL